MPDKPRDDGQHGDMIPSRNRHDRLFLAGGLFVWEFSLPVGQLTFAATVLIRGTALELWDAELFPIGGGHLSLGVSGIRQLIDQLCHLARTDGLDIVRLSGYRMGGASPGRLSDLHVVCRDANTMPMLPGDER